MGSSKEGRLLCSEFMLPENFNKEGKLLAQSLTLGALWYGWTRSNATATKALPPGVVTVAVGRCSCRRWWWDQRGRMSQKRHRR